MINTFKKIVLVVACGMALTACASSSDMPTVVQSSPTMPELRLTQGMATQIEMPSSGRVQSVVTGNPALVTAERDGSIVNLLPKAGSGETNLIVRAVGGDGESKVYQYRLIVEGP